MTLQGLCRFFTLIVPLAVSAIAADNLFGTVGIFPHYAVGNEWTTTIYLDVDGTGKNIDGRTLSTCVYKIDFYNTNGVILNTQTASYSSDYSFKSNLLKIIVPDFNSGQLAYGPVTVSTDCSESFPIKTGELVFSQRVGDKTNDGTVPFQKYQGADSVLMDLSKFGYGFAVYNPSQNARAVFGYVYDAATKITTIKNKLLFTLAGREQKIFMVTDVLPELKGKSNLWVIQFNESPYEGLGQAPMYLVLKFNQTGLFSTGSMYNSYIY